jgi:bacterioferritin (cytochrome b1)
MSKNDALLVKLLCVAFAKELKAYHGYLHAYVTVTGPLESVYGQIYKKFMEREMHHLEELGKKIIAMGGMPPTEYPPITAIAEAVYKGYDETLSALQDAEIETLRMYVKIHEVADKVGDLPLVLLIEEIIQEEEEHHDELQRILLDVPTKNTEKHKKLIVDAFSARKLKLAQLMKNSEEAAQAIVALINTIRPAGDNSFNKSVKNNVAKINAGSLSFDKMTGGALIGQVVNFVKAVLRGQEHGFIADTLNKVMNKL